jgi:predicted RNA polymerase sigma factor
VAGVPQNPGAWLMAAPKNRAIDHFRRNARLERKHEELGREFAEREKSPCRISILLSTTTLETTFCASSSRHVTRYCLRKEESR